jgi:hypothetical protein
MEQKQKQNAKSLCPKFQLTLAPGEFAQIVYDSFMKNEKYCRRGI